ncbi:MAG: hypothetical protein COA31_008895 [Flavobacteriales bacterium]|nr:hypothetical protein [Flavobacteriales bacterium]
MQKLWQTYKYIYYWLYTWNRGLWGERDAPEFNILIGMSMSAGCNILSIIVLIDIVFGVTIFPEAIPKLEALISIAILFLIHYFLFVYKNKYRKIEIEFEKESKEERKRKGKWVLLYAFGSMGFYIFLLFLGIWIKK